MALNPLYKLLFCMFNRLIEKRAAVKPWPLVFFFRLTSSLSEWKLAKVCDEYSLFVTKYL